MKKDKGFTLIELIMVIVILGILAAVAIPKFISLRNEANEAVCKGNLAAVRSGLSGYYAKSVFTGGSGAFPATLNNTNFVGSYFVDGALPVCPLGSTWAYTSSTGAVTTHDHTP